MTAKPHFFKVMMGDFSKELRIPPAFLKHISEETSENVILVGPSGGHWHVKASKRRNTDMYLEDGWQEFVEDHSLEGADFLLFGYNGKMHFTVQIFDKTACEREDAFTAKPSQESGSYKEKKRWFKLHKNLSSPLSSKNSLGGNSKTHYNDLSLHGSNLYTPMKTEEEVLDLVSSELVANPRKFHFSPKRHVADKGNSKLRLKSYSFTSTNPFFREHMTEVHLSRGVYMRVPSKFCSAYLPCKSTSVVLRNLEGKSWTVKYIVSSYNKILSAGWAAFARENKLKVGDECIFELVDNKVMQVHILRGH